MNGTVWIILVTAVIFLALILQLAGKPSITSKVTGSLLAITAVGGLCLYGYGFSVLIENKVLAVVRTLFAVIGMYMGRNEVSAMTSVPLFQKPFFVILLWMMHICAIYTLSSAAITTVGANALKALRLKMARKGSLTLIFGADPQCLSFGRSCARKKNESVIFISSSADSAADKAIQGMGASLRNDDAALHPGHSFLKSIGIRPGKRPIRVYCLEKNENKNLIFAQELLRAMEAEGIDPEQTSVSINGDEAVLPAVLQASDQQYGYGFVHVFSTASLASRLLMQKCPPSDVITFDEKGCAKQDFHALVIGFGQVGQSVLRALIMNSQFVGSSFRATVMTKDVSSESGYMKAILPAMFKHYDIEFIESDARGEKLFSFLSANRHSVSYIAVCLSNESMNREITQDIMRFTQNIGISPLIAQCSYFGVNCRASLKEPEKQWPLYSSDTLSPVEADRLAVMLNQEYSKGNGRSAWENWLACDAFGRMSSRASADYLPAMIRAAGTDMETVQSEGFEPDKELLLNLGISEHRRWCAFHFCSGYDTMTEEELAEREAIWRKEKKESGKASIRIAKNTAARTHACLIPWEELDALSARENAVTGGSVDYCQMDIDNVLCTVRMLKENA